MGECSFIFLMTSRQPLFVFFFLNDPPPPEFYTLPLHDPLPISAFTSSGSSPPVPRAPREGSAEAGNWRSPPRPSRSPSWGGSTGSTSWSIAPAPPTSWWPSPDEIGRAHV